MKSIFKIIGICSLIISLFSCTNSPKETVKEKTDTVAVAYAPKGTENWALARAVYGIGKKWAFGDSAHSEGNYKIDTNMWKFYFLVDTLRDANKKPIFDTALHQWKANWQFVELNEAQKSAIIIHVLPHVKLDTTKVQPK